MSIKKIAEKAGVSISTVSRILNRPDYKCSVPGLREKVWSIAMEMNYVVFYQKSGICRFFLMIENAEEKILTRSFSECILRQKKIKMD